MVVLGVVRLTLLLLWCGWPDPCLEQLFLPHLAGVLKLGFSSLIWGTRGEGCYSSM